ncbi:MAG: alpha/beta hydrolase [Caldilineales bacterium]
MSLVSGLVKRLLRRQFSGWSQGSIEEQRARQERSTRLMRLPAGVKCRNVLANGVAAEWVEGPAAGAGVILYLHGGAYVLGSVDGHREWIARLAKATGTRALAINYRLAPEHPFPCALEDTLAAYRWLLDQGVRSSDIVLAGDSAGGGLAVAALLALRDAGEHLPAGAVCISPWADLTLSGASVQSQAELDPILDPDSLRMYARCYAADQPLATPLLSPVFADMTGLPPLLIQVGTDEILLDDAIRLAERARIAGVDVTLQVWAEMFHVFQLISFLPETRQAVNAIAEFCARLFSPPQS